MCSGDRRFEISHFFYDEMFETKFVSSKNVKPISSFCFEHKTNFRFFGWFRFDRVKKTNVSATEGLVSNNSTLSVPKSQDTNYSVESARRIRSAGQPLLRKKWRCRYHQRHKDYNDVSSTCYAILKVPRYSLPVFNFFVGENTTIAMRALVHARGSRAVEF